MEDFSGKAKQFTEDVEFKKTGAGLGEALGTLGHELKRGYERVRDALKD